MSDIEVEESEVKETAPSAKEKELQSGDGVVNIAPPPPAVDTEMDTKASNAEITEETHDEDIQEFNETFDIVEEEMAPMEQSAIAEARVLPEPGHPTLNVARPRLSWGHGIHRTTASEKIQNLQYEIDRTQVHLQQLEKNGKLPDSTEYKQELKESAESLPALVKQTRKEIFQKCKEAAEGSSKAVSANEVSEMARLLKESASPHAIKGLQVFQHQGMRNPMYMVPHEFMRTHLMPSVLMQARIGKELENLCKDQERNDPEQDEKDMNLALCQTYGTQMLQNVVQGHFEDDVIINLITNREEGRLEDCIASQAIQARENKTKFLRNMEKTLEKTAEMAAYEDDDDSNTNQLTAEYKRRIAVLKSQVSNLFDDFTAVGSSEMRVTQKNFILMKRVQELQKSDQEMVSKYEAKLQELEEASAKDIQDNLLATSKQISDESQANLGTMEKLCRDMQNKIAGMYDDSVEAIRQRQPQQGQHSMHTHEELQAEVKAANATIDRLLYSLIIAQERESASSMRLGMVPKEQLMQIMSIDISKELQLLQGEVIDGVHTTPTIQVGKDQTTEVVGTGPGKAGDIRVHVPRVHFSEADRARFTLSTQIIKNAKHYPYKANPQARDSGIYILKSKTNEAKVDEPKKSFENFSTNQNGTNSNFIGSSSSQTDTRDDVWGPSARPLDQPEEGAPHKKSRKEVSPKHTFWAVCVPGVYPNQAEHQDWAYPPLMDLSMGPLWKNFPEEKKILWDEAYDILVHARTRPEYVIVHANDATVDSLSWLSGWQLDDDTMRTLPTKAERYEAKGNMHLLECLSPGHMNFAPSALISTMAANVDLQNAVRFCMGHERGNPLMKAEYFPHPHGSNSMTYEAAWNVWNSSIPTSTQRGPTKLKKSSIACGARRLQQFQAPEQAMILYRMWRYLPACAVPIQAQCSQLKITHSIDHDKVHDWEESFLYQTELVEVPQRGTNSHGKRPRKVKKTKWTATGLSTFINRIFDNRYPGITSAMLTTPFPNADSGIFDRQAFITEVEQWMFECEHILLELYRAVDMEWSALHALVYKMHRIRIHELYMAMYSTFKDYSCFKIGTQPRRPMDFAKYYSLYIYVDAEGNPTYRRDRHHTDSAWTKRVGSSIPQQITPKSSVGAEAE